MAVEIDRDESDGVRRRRHAGGGYDEEGNQHHLHQHHEPPASAIEVAHVRSASSAVLHHVVDGDEKYVDYQYDLPGWYRWFMITAFCLISLIAGPIFFNWPPLDDMFHWAGAYAKGCSPDGDDTFEIRDLGEVYCNDQKLKIESMSSLAVSVMYIFDFVAGILLDAFGAKVTTTFGLTLATFGWLFIVVSSADGFQGYKVGIFLLAAGCDPTLFGMLSVGNLFPGWSSTAIAALGTLRSCAFAMPLLLRAVWSSNRSGITLRGISLVMLFIYLALGLFAAIFIPWQPYPKLAPGKRIDRSSGKDKLSYKKTMKKLPRIDIKLFWSSAKAQVLACKEYALTWAYLALIYIACAQLLRNSYYGITYKHHLPSTQSFYELMSPLSLIPCPFMGMLADYVSAAITMSVICFSAALAMLFAMFNGKGSEVISILFNWEFNSFISSEFYVYLAYNYPPHLYGKLAGFVLLVGGLVGLLGDPMNKYVDRTGNYNALDIVVTIFGLVAGTLAIGLHFLKERGIRKLAKEGKEREKLRLQEEHRAATQATPEY